MTNWINQVTAVTTTISAKLDTLANDASMDGGKIHLSALADSLSDVAPDVDPVLLKSMASDFINSLPDFKVVRGQYGGAMRDNDINRPKKELAAEAVAARKADREAKRATAQAEKEHRRRERAEIKATKATELAAQAETARQEAEEQLTQSADESTATETVAV